MRERVPLLGGLALIAIAFVIGSIAIGHGIRDRNQNNVIVVTGSAKKRITSDYVIWTLSVTSTQASATDAAKELGGWATRIRSFLAGEGVQPAELSVQPISTAVISKGGHVRAYRLTRRFEIRSGRVREITGVADHSARLRAKVIVKATGSSLGSLRGVDVGVFQVTSPNSTEVEDYGVYDTSTLDKDVTAVVNVTFGVG